MEQEIQELAQEFSQLNQVGELLESVLDGLQEVKLTREKAIARTKIEEARMWLHKRQDQLMLELIQSGDESWQNPKTSSGSGRCSTV